MLLFINKTKDFDLKFYNISVTFAEASISFSC